MSDPQTQRTTGPPTTDRNEQDVQPPRRPRSVLPSLMFISFVLFMVTNNQSEEMTARNQYVDALQGLSEQIGNYSTWLNGTAPDSFALPIQDSNLQPLVESFVSFGSRLDPHIGSYYANLTGFWRGDVDFRNLTGLQTNGTAPPPAWHQLAHDFTANANLTNATELNARLGDWNWTRSSEVAISFGDRVMWSEGEHSELSKDIAMIHGKIDFTDPRKSEEFRLEVDGVHFISNGTIYAFAQPVRQGVDIRNIPMLVPPARMNDTARIIKAELEARASRLKERIDAGLVEESSEDEGPKSGCSFQFFAQLEPTDVPAKQLQEVEEEVDNPTGITTARAPEMKFRSVLVSQNCGILYELPDITGMKSQTLFRKITTYAGLATLVNLALLLLLVRQAAISRSAAGLSRVSRYPFIIQTLIDAVSFVGHITLAILADGRTSVAALAPAGLACVLFVQEAQFSILIGQIQAPEDVRPTTPTPAVAPNPTPPVAPTPTPPVPPDSTTEAGMNTANPPAAPAGRATGPPAPQPPQPNNRPGLLRYLFEHMRNDPSARLWAIISFFLLVVFRLVIALSMPLVFVGLLYSSMWSVQIYRTARRGRASGLTTEYLVGTTLCRLYYLLYFLACPENILDVAVRKWVYGVALFMFAQVGVILLQTHLGPAFFLPPGMVNVNTYNYHPPMPLPDPEAPEQSLGDCVICMDAITIDPALRQRSDEKSDSLARRTGGLLAQGARKNYSLAPCHHLFHTACLERWLAIKNICPQCRRPLPPL